MMIVAVSPNLKCEIYSLPGQPGVTVLRLLAKLIMIYLREAVLKFLEFTAIASNAAEIAVITTATITIMAMQTEFASNGDFEQDYFVLPFIN